MLFLVTILGPLAGEPPEPMTREQFEAARKRLKATLNGVVTMDKRPRAADRRSAIAWL